MRYHTDNNERGAVAVIIALCMVLLMGIAAIAIDVGFGFNERRQSQSAADMAVMAGATEVVLGGGQQEVVNNVLTFARANLNITYTDAEWQTMWQNCTDPDRLGFDVGTGTPVDFQPLPEPAAWGVGELECISSVASYLRVRIPNQIIGTTFARAIGFDTLTTNAAAVARIEPGGEVGGVLPFGIAGGTGDGEVCLSTAPSGVAYPPCQGPSGGGFGTINSKFFGDFFGSSSCLGTAGATEIRQNVALGIDHAIGLWPESAALAAGVFIGQPHPGDNNVSWYPERGYDDCQYGSGGSVEPPSHLPGQDPHVTPPNTMRVSTGFADSNAVEEGLVSNMTFLGEPSRLQQEGNPKRLIWAKKAGGPNQEQWLLDNKGLWDYLNGTNSIFGVPECNGNTYPGLTPEEKVARIHTCLQKYTAAGSTVNLFDASIQDSPRLVWAPEYWHAASTTGTSWQPVHGFRLVFLAGTYFNCDASSMTCPVVFYPDLASTEEMCDESGPSHCHQLSLKQLTAFLLPTDALPDDAIPGIPGQQTGFTISLFK